MNLLDGLLVAWGNLRSNRMRSALTMLGVVIGVACVIVMIAIVEGARKQVLEEFKGLGSNFVFVFFSPESREGDTRRTRVEGLTVEDADAIRRECTEAETVSAEVNARVKVQRGAKEVDATLVGVGAEYQKLREIQISRGRFLGQQDVDNWNQICVLGPDLSSELFPNEIPLHREVTVQGLRLTVVGVAKSRGRSFGENYDEYVYMPITAVHKRLTGDDKVGVIYAAARTAQVAESLADHIWTTLMRRHGNQPDFIVDTQSHVLKAIEKVLATFRWVLGGVGALSLLVGGIGIMNIMLVSVTERTREIGVRKAVGATRSNILLQFLTESMTLSGVGGLVGIALGWTLSFTLGLLARDLLPTFVPAWAAVTGFTFALGVGVFFGIYPAYRAAALDPIVALRYE